MLSSSRHLAGKRILVTRPLHQADRICRLIVGAGGHAIRLPLLSIADPKDNSRPIQLLKHLDHFDMAIFISSNAVRKTGELMNTLGIRFPSHLKLAAIGKQTAKTMRELRYRVDLAPQHIYNSEAFLAMPEALKIKGLNIIIFRGVGGREQLRCGLLERGAGVEYAEVYRRVKPSLNDRGVRRILYENRIDLITITSSEAVQNLHDLISKSGQQSLLDRCLLAGSQHIADKAHHLNFTRVKISPDPSDSSMFTGILNWAKHSERCP